MSTGTVAPFALPEGVTVGTSDVTAVADVRDDLVTLVREYGTLYEWAERQPQPRALRGRAPVYVAPLPSSGVQVVVRHAWHGGLLAPLTGDRFRRPTRAPIEMQQSAALRAAGIPTTDVVGFARYAAGAGLARVDVVTRYVEHTADLGMVLAGLSAEMDCEPALTATQHLLLQLARHGVVHPDLNVKNILLRACTDQDSMPSPMPFCAMTNSSTPARLEALVIDVDVIDWVPVRAARETMERNVSRLVRSLQKWRTQFGCDLADQRIAHFRDTTLALVER